MLSTRDLRTCGLKSSLKSVIFIDFVCNDCAVVHWGRIKLLGQKGGGVPQCNIIARLGCNLDPFGSVNNK